MIKVENLTKSFGDHNVVNGLTFEIAKGEQVTIIGESGCGKSTILQLILGLTKPDSGYVAIDSIDITKLRRKELMNVRKKCAMVFQSAALFDSLPIWKNVGFSLLEHTKLSERKIKRIAEEKLELVGLSTDISEQLPSSLSGGMKKRVAIARAIAKDPEIILYDEPTTGLDPITSTIIEDLINKLSLELKVTSVVVTHQISTILRTSPRIIMIHQGKVIEAGNKNDILNSSNKIIYNFVNGIKLNGKNNEK
jgi:phospholipid/cholesterol/gamma-HCH transport system ATP-binding protein